MPVQKVLLPSGSVGYRWGLTGHIYTGHNARVMAASDGQAIGYKSKK
jgi:hypothetical protein